uniref:Uncharacterized protein n=1 Tax=Boodleopsis pusilla TaxID=381415 RepID=A0A386AZJ7_9CHLO|nr:hypothetical protein [Boodleopsis pusilla]AYC64862.1 hypothetical protein [Boodleopsis pusilla]
MKLKLIFKKSQIIEEVYKINRRRRENPPIGSPSLSFEVGFFKQSTSLTMRTAPVSQNPQFSNTKKGLMESIKVLISLLQIVFLFEIQRILEGSSEAFSIFLSRGLVSVVCSERDFSRQSQSW